MVDRDKIDGKSGREEKRDLWDAYRLHVRQFLHPKLVDGSRTESKDQAREELMHESSPRLLHAD